jgi:hypothetical protein
MFAGKSGYSDRKLIHTCLINISRRQGAFHATMRDGEPVGKDWDRKNTFHGTYTRDRLRIHVFVYGGIMKQSTIKALLEDWLNGKWVNGKWEINGKWVNGKWEIKPLEGLTEGETRKG